MNLRADTYLKVAKKNFWNDLLFHLPSALIIMFYSKSWLYNWTISLVKESESLYQFLKDWQNYFHLPLILIAIILPLWNKYKASINVVFSNSEELRIRILDSFNLAVNSKGNRFREMYEQRKSNPNISDGKVFNTITQPITQIKILSENLLIIFREINKSKAIKLTTVVCKDNEMVNFVFHSDFTPKVTIDELKNNDSTAKKMFSKQKECTLF